MCRVAEYQILVAMGFFALTVLRRWRKWARREAGLRRLFEKLSIGDTMRHWKQAARLDAFQATLQRLAMRGALQRWKRELKRRTAFEMAAIHHSRTLVSKVGSGVKRRVSCGKSRHDTTPGISCTFAIKCPGEFKREHQNNFLLLFFVPRLLLE